jgi:dTDP-4-dehydrorhamnose 3,5-epimerase
MRTIETGIPGLLIVEPTVFGDERGWFMETHSAPKFEALGIEPGAVQMNHSFSNKGVLRGLHFQSPPQDQTKLVRCVRGRLYDVAVDIRRGSPTFGHWFGLELSVENKKMLFVPSGFAHGFYSIEDCELLYICGKAAYAKAAEGGLRYSCPDCAIAWPFDGVQPTVNERDASFPTLAELQSPFVFEAVKVEAAL